MRRRVAAIILFLLLLAGVTGAAGKIVGAKFINDSTTMINGFYAEDKNSIDVLVVGSSNAFCTIDPVVLYEEEGIAAYDFCSSSQPMNLSLLYVKEAFKKQTPKVVALEVNMIPAENITHIPENRLRWGLTDMPLTIDKLKCLYQSLGRVDAEYMSYVFPVLRYHGRWKELSKQDYTYMFADKSNFTKGYLVTQETSSEMVNLSDYDSEGETWIEDDVENCVKQIADLCDQKGAKLVLFKSPRQEWYQYHTRAVRELADKYGLEYVDYNELKEEIGLDAAADFRDGEHLNDYGAAKVTRHFGSWLKSQYDLPDRREGQKDNSWDEALQYKARLDAAPCQGTSDVHNCMDRLAGDDSYLAILTYTETPDHIYQWIYKGGKIVFYKEWTQTGVEHYVYDKEDIVFGKLDGIYQILIAHMDFYQMEKPWSVIAYDTITHSVADTASFDE